MKHIKYGMERCNLKEGEVVMLQVYGTYITAVVRSCPETRCRDCCLYQIWHEDGTGKCAKFSRLNREWDIPVFSFVPVEEVVE